MNDRRAEVMRRSCWGIAILGVAIRLAIYLYNRSLWLDEAMLASNVLRCSYGELLGRLEYNQISPPLFLVISKLVHQLLGHLEYSLRLLPLMCSCITLCLLGRLLQRVSARFFALCALLLFALGLADVDWATSFKHYALDQLSTVLVLYAAVSWPGYSRRKRYAVAAALPALLWLSFTSTFVLVGLILVAGSYALKLKQRTGWQALFVLIISMCLIGSALYVVSAQHSIGNEHQAMYWAKAYPQPPFGAWLMGNLVNVLGSTTGMEYAPLLAFIICIWGACSLVRSPYSSIALVASGALGCALAAAFLRIYPLMEGRLSVYFAPIALIFLARGLESLNEVWRAKVFRRIVAAISVAIVLIAAYGLVRYGGNLLVREEMRDVAEFIRQYPDDGVPILVSAAAGAPFNVYGGALLKRRVAWLQNWGVHATDLHSAWIAAGAPFRFWVVLSHTDFDRKDAAMSEIRPLCKVIDSMNSGSSGAVLLEIRSLSQT